MLVPFFSSHFEKGASAFGFLLYQWRIEVFPRASGSWSTETQMPCQTPIVKDGTFKNGVVFRFSFWKIIMSARVVSGGFGRARIRLK